MASQDQNRGSMPFWEFFQTFHPSRATGHGVDHNAAPFPPFPAGFPFGGPGHRAPPGPPPPPGAAWDADFEWGPRSHDDEHGPSYGWASRRGWRHDCRGHGHGRRHRGDDNEDEAAAPANQAEREVNNEKGEYSPDTMDEDVPDPAEVTPDEDAYPPPPYGPGHPGHGHGHGRRGYGRCRRGGPHRGGFRRRGGHHDPPFDFAGMMRSVMNHPFFQGLRDQAQRYAGPNINASDDSNAFSPPVDVFNTKAAYVVHVALPGARKEDVGVTWNPDAGTLDVAGVVHRPGDESFLSTLAAGERRVGVFERSIALPPAGADEKEDVDGLHITAKMEDGILVLVVPKVEKEWTEIRKVDIE
ncbi:Heat shock protein 16 [Tolypocladium ophioglossoides CBS 100239]|uniref:Heat shock protein 16 n=1 Tax=Tolypocladium ophioglossoides (strain CBS 100239) TaxID=1163406 RepID=A0A0L0NME9_TOLOC|nr:Heat shock protein 16 [Tolypocladium ophioglossoides CBS 100239]